MKMRRKLACMLSMLILLIAQSFAIGNFYGQSKAQVQIGQYRSPFRYAIVSNEIIDVMGNGTGAFRHVGILLDEKAFSEQTLRELFKLVSTRFPMPIRLDVQVFTSLEQVETPEEEAEGYESEMTDIPEANKYHNALFVRSQSEELIRYSDSLPVRGWKTVTLKAQNSGVSPK